MREELLREAIMDEKPVNNPSPVRKSMGAYFAAVAVVYALLRGTTLPVWEALLVGLVIWYCLHMVAGLNMKWSYSKYE